MAYSKENYNFPKIQGSNFFQGGSNFYQGWGGQVANSYGTGHFPGGSRPTVPIWIWACDLFFVGGGGGKA